jgi:hypothetical protein
VLPESESFSKLISDLSVKAVSCKIDTNNGNVSEGSNLESSSPSSCAEVTDNMMTLRSSESQELFNMTLPRCYLTVSIVLPNCGVFSRLASCLIHPFSSLCKP